MIEHVTRVTLLPTGAALDDWNVHPFQVTVEWRGVYQGKHGGGYAISNDGLEYSRGGSWGWPERYQRWQYRWETLEEALAIARVIVADVQINGRTWAEWNDQTESPVRPPERTKV